MSTRHDPSNCPACHTARRHPAYAPLRRHLEAAPFPRQQKGSDRLRAHAVQHLAERGQTPSPEHWADWHAFLDIDPDLRDYTTGGTR